MAITLKEIIAHVESLGFKHMPGPRENSEICLRFATESYVNTDGDHSLLIVCAISDEGRYLEVFAPAAYTTANCKYKAAMFACMLKAAFMTKHLQLEHDPDDGEVRLAVDMPVLDGTVTADQLCALILAITLSLESFHPVFALRPPRLLRPRSRPNCRSLSQRSAASTTSRRSSPPNVRRVARDDHGRLRLHVRGTDRPRRAAGPDPLLA